MKKILIVDDEQNILMTLEYAFKKKNYLVFIARDGQEALDLMHIEIPNLVILDIMMPEVDGYAALHAMKENPLLRNCKVIFLSAKNQESDIEKGLLLGADAYVTKPFSIKKLLEKVENLLVD